MIMALFWYVNHPFLAILSNFRFSSLLSEPLYSMLYALPVLSLSKDALCFLPADDLSYRASGILPDSLEVENLLPVCEHVT